ncbi:MAG: hypothetical protein OT477_08355 [Chloroflexi bacterium]|nr:hypothetical protein [Chloroflexota bacterium]
MTTFHPLPEQRAQMEIDALVDAEAFGRIQLGFTPADMQDKWHMRMEEGQWLRCYRSWTGHCIYEVRFEWGETAEGEGYTIPEAWVNRDPTQYRNEDTAYDARMFIYLVRRLLLGHNVTLPAPNALSHKHKLVHEKHVMGEKDNGRPSVILLD